MDQKPRGPQGLARSVELFKAYRIEQSDPDTFYRLQAQDTMVQIQRDLSLDGAFVLDVGGGAGYFSEAMKQEGATVILVEPEAGLTMPEPLCNNDSSLTQEDRHRRAVWPGRLNPGHTVAGDGYELPFADDTFDVVFSSNVLEHVADPKRFIEESMRVTKPGGYVYVSFTAWFSPQGGHETMPWHFLGGEYAAKRYERKHGKPPGNLYGTSMFRCDVGQVMRIVRKLGNAEIVREEPRYFPQWLGWVIYVPGFRELATWNLAMTLRVIS